MLKIRHQGGRLSLGIRELEIVDAGQILTGGKPACISSHLTQMLGVDISSYNIYNELGFLLKPTMRRFIQPTLAKYLGGLTDAEVEEMALEYAEAMREKANERGYINLFGIHVGANAFDGLKDILTAKFNE